MRIVAVIDRYMTDNVRPNSLTIVEKYPFSDLSTARDFVSSIRKIDRRVCSANIEFHEI